MDTLYLPRTPQELAEVLSATASAGHTIALEGAGSKRLMAGPVESGATRISTTALTRVLDYEPADLTISVEAGLPWCELTRLVAANHQMIPLDPPFSAAATVGGVLASNTSGPRRRLYGTARDMVIGLRFATLEGKLVDSGGKVVKNVAGLDMAKLMIGSFGTLAAIATVNFKLHPMAESERSFLLPFTSAASAAAGCSSLLQSPLQPAAVDLLNPAAGARIGHPAWLLAVRAGGNPAACDRYQRELTPVAGSDVSRGESHEQLWREIGELTPGFLAARPGGAVVRASCTLKEVGAVLESFPGPALARAGSGVCYGYFDQADDAAAWLHASARQSWKTVIEFSPGEWKRTADLWPVPGADLELMQRVKNLFDPANRLNRGRLYGRI